MLSAAFLVEDEMSAKHFSPKKCGVPWCAVAALLLGLIPAGARAQSYEACGPAPAVKAALDQLPRLGPADTHWQVYRHRLAALQALMRQYPDDVFVPRAYIQAMHSTPDKEKVIAEYKSRYEQNLSPQLAYLYGLTLVGRDTPEGINLMDEAVTKDPAFALPHLELAMIYRSHAFFDKAQDASQLKAFLDACPASLEGYQALAHFDDRELVLPYATKLRTLIEGRSDPDAVEAYRTLWSLEFKTHPASEYGPLRAKVAQDLERLRQLNLVDTKEWYQTLAAGYRLLKDEKQAAWADKQYMTRFQPESVAMDEWFDEHMFPGADASPSTKHAFYSELFAQSGEWLKKSPNNLMIWAWYRLLAIENLDDIPAAEVESNAEQFLEAADRDLGPRGPYSSQYSEAAEVLSQKHLAPQREVNWAEKGLAQWDIESSEPRNDLDTSQEQEKLTADRAYNRLQLLGYETDGYLELKRKDSAEVQLDQMNRWLQDFKSLPGNADSAKETARLYTLYWGLRAREAELQGHKEDAMGFYENALLARLAALQKPATGGKDELADSAHKLWKSLGGTEEGWQLWYARPANDAANHSAAQWQDADEPLPAFRLTDLNGKTWDLAALRGKTVFMNFWASWCGPCRLELPHLQELADQYKDRPDVQFITLNMDANPGLAQPVTKELSLSLVVIPAYSFALARLNVGPLPENWIADNKGVVRLKGIGYDPSKNWKAGVNDAIEKVKALEAATSSARVSP